MKFEASSGLAHKFRTEWPCRYGHINTVSYVMISPGSFTGGSAWDRCGRCNGTPSPVQLMQCSMSIFSQWLAHGLIDRARWREFSRWALSGQEKDQGQVRGRTAAEASTLQPTRRRNLSGRPRSAGRQPRSEPPTTEPGETEWKSRSPENT